MATDLENLTTRRSAILTTLASITSGPSYSIDGQSVDQNAYRQSLVAELREINALMASIAGPFDVDSQAVT